MTAFSTVQMAGYQKTTAAMPSAVESTPPRISRNFFIAFTSSFSSTMGEVVTADSSLQSSSLKKATPSTPEPVWAPITGVNSVT